jgi:5'-3' exonuclease
MGIPYYFSYIVKKHSKIISSLQSLTKPIDNFFLDCNSIIYDVVHNISEEEYKTLSQRTIHNYIIQHTIQKIEKYIELVKPTNIVYIAFDGVAPVAKLTQQKERRYKSWYQTKIETMKTNGKNKTNPNKTTNKTPTNKLFNTCEITPGTEFMTLLNKTVFEYYSSQKSIIVSTSGDYGEGEHKLFEFIRTSPLMLPESVNLVYGLDADLIMLCINHLPLFSHIYLYRETPEFIKYLNKDLEPNQNYYLDIPLLANTITNVMCQVDTVLDKKNDYIFLCFMLGNDFLPHFPSINIRTGGIDKLLNAYNFCIGCDEIITDGKTIHWVVFFKLISYLSNLEEGYIRKEVNLRNTMEQNMNVDTNDQQSILENFENIPLFERSMEKQINIYKTGWEKRYYETCNDMKNTKKNIEKICVNYLEGLEWTLHYYTTGCVDWRWCYHYHYPPLLKDLLAFVPKVSSSHYFVALKEPQPVSSIVQLSFVLPKPYLYLLPKEVENKLMKDHAEWYTDDFNFKWVFCKYFWEAHVVFPEIKIEDVICCFFK